MTKTRKSCTGLLALLAMVAISLLASGEANAQCMPDNLDFLGQCCDPSEARLPDFPEFKQEIRYFTWRDCRLARNKKLCVDILAPQPFILPDGNPAGCGVYTIPFNMRTCGAQMRTLFSGRLTGTYTRTWLEDTDPGQQGLETQVWRILLNGDLMPSDFLIARFGTNPHIPQCYTAFNNQIYWAGYIDYRLDCQNNRWSAQWVLDHECDKYHHNSDGGRPGTFHARRSFNFAGPSTFTPTLDIPFSHGTVVQENVRSIVWPAAGPLICLRDEPIIDGFINPVAELCACQDGDPQYAITEFFAGGVCGSFFQSGAGTKEFVQKKLGFFPTAIPGATPKQVLLKMGDMIYADACTQQTTVEYFEGVEIIGGPPAFTFGTGGAIIPLAPDFDDDASSNDLNCEKLKAVPHVSCKIICANIVP